MVSIQNTTETHRSISNMPIYTDTLPQSTAVIKTMTFKDLLSVLPEKLPLKKNFWISGRLAKFGITPDNLIFLTDSNDEPDIETRSLFQPYINKLGFDSTVSNHWRNSRLDSVRLYSEGELIFDKETLACKKLPLPTDIPKITAKEILEKLPETIPWNETLYLTGGIVKNGFSCNDADIICFELTDATLLGKMRDFFTKTFGWRTDVGIRVMTEREPVYLYKIYEGGKRCLP